MYRRDSWGDEPVYERSTGRRPQERIQQRKPKPKFKVAEVYYVKRDQDRECPVPSLDVDLD